MKAAKTRWLAMIAGLSLLMVNAVGRADGLVAVKLACEWLEAPSGVTTREPRLSWIVEPTDRDARGASQSAWRILVASEPALVADGAADLWDSGRVASSQSSEVVYQGKPLESGQQAWWRVQVWDQEGRASAWSEPASWTMGLLEPAAWRGSWISARDAAPLHADPKALYLPPARSFRKPFSTTKPVRRAVLHGTALGLVEWSIDGRRASEELLQPGWTAYHERVPARTIDVTALLQDATDAGKAAGNEAGAGAPRQHCLGATVADGWYAGYVGYGLLVGYGPHQTGRSIYGKTPAILCQLDVEYVDGTRESIVTDTSWRVTDSGPIREADLLMGETYDARREMPGWDTAAFVAEEAVWQPAVAAEANGGTRAPFHEPGTSREVDVGFAPPRDIVAYTAPPIRVTETLPARSVDEWRPGVHIFDLGQNFAGVVRLKVAAAAGTPIRLRFGEMRHADGRLMTENLRRARATDTYVCKGDGIETWTPRFTYHGFQFVEVTGLPPGPAPLDTVTGLVIQNATPPAGRFACSDEALTKFWRNTQWTQRANFIEVPTDCPQRDERLGWMGDAQIYARTATFNADVAAFFTKWIDDVRESQLRDGPDAGAYPDYAPYPFAHGKPGARFGTAWTDAGVICPWTMWRVYGDERLVRRHWESMTRFMEWRARQDPRLEGADSGNPWGDWLNVDENTPLVFIDLCYHAQSARMMAEMAAALGHAEQAAAYRGRCEHLAESFRRRHVRPDGTLAVDTQTACVLALDMGLVAGGDAGPVVAQLVQRIERNGCRMATGFLGTKAILPVLTAHGHHDLACRLFQSRQFPSWGFEVEQGANSVWERWDSYTKEHGFDGATGGNNAAMNSFSHYAFGAVMEWAFRDLAGIDALEPGYRRIRIAPRLPQPGSNPERAPIDWVEADYDGPRGRIESHWRRRDGGIEMQVRVPANTTAELLIPAAGVADVLEGDRPLAATPGIRVIGMRDGVVVVEVGSGRYRFAARAVD
jgi:alpha-L-rhamnosidase